jgi:hypothetical protein
MDNFEKENKRAERLAFRIGEYRIILNNMYDNLVDRNFKLVDTDAKFLIMEMRQILKSIPEDDF